RKVWRPFADNFVMTRCAKVRIGMGIGALQRAGSPRPIKMTTDTGAWIGAGEVVVEWRRQQLGFCCAVGSFGNVRRQQVTLNQRTAQCFSKRSFRETFGRGDGVGV